ncbi:hypothetical protein [Legionella spiritensis]|uniref:hypothetical protein n=1 Tax=Legionella spiritensis TaxID=452 RepID=UPI000F6EF7EC|nr:hypothetical protein [Legionella spiritensis]VEG90473.1 Uncharacterised protein [Legionella spiritensis]
MPTVDEIRDSGWADLPLINCLNQLYQATGLHERLDLLITIYESCRNAAHPEQIKLGHVASEMIGIICNTDDSYHASQARKRYKAIDPLYIPNQDVPHLSSTDRFSSRDEFLKKRLIEHMVANKKHYLHVPAHLQRSDKLLKVIRLNEKQREECRVLIANGHLWQFKMPTEDKPQLVLEKFDTSHHIAHSKYHGRVIFVVSPWGELFASSSELGKFHHSSFLNGQPVLMAGMLEAREGSLTYINEHSGHYSPGVFAFYNFLKILKSKGVINDDTKIQLKRNQKGGLVLDDGQVLNTSGFLGRTHSPGQTNTALISATHKILTRYNELFELIISDSQIDEQSPLLRSFAVSMVEYLRQIPEPDEQTQSSIEELQEFISDGIKPSVQELTTHLMTVKSFLLGKGLPDTAWIDEFLSQYQNDRVDDMVRYLENTDSGFIEALLNACIHSDFEQTDLENIIKDNHSDPETIIIAVMKVLSKCKVSPMKPFTDMTLSEFCAWTLSRIKHGDELVLSDYNLSHLSIAQIKLLDLITCVKGVSTLKIAGCKLNEFSSENWLPWCQLLRNPNYRSLHLASNSIGTFNAEHLQSLVDVFSDKESSILSLNLADNNLNGMDDQAFTLCVELINQSTNLKELNLSLCAVHRLSTKRLTQLLDAICKSNIQFLHLGHSPMEAMSNENQALFFDRLSKSKLQKIRISGKWLSVAFIDSLREKMQTNYNQSFLQPWGTGLQGLALAELMKNKTALENVKKNNPFLYSIFTRKVKELETKGVVLTEESTCHRL